MTCIANTNIKHNGVEYKNGDVIKNINPKDAKSLTKIKAATILKTEDKPKATKPKDIEGTTETTESK
jgi:hypothetical protein